MIILLPSQATEFVSGRVRSVITSASTIRAIWVETGVERPVRRGERLHIQFEESGSFWTVECKVARCKKAEAGSLIQLEPLAEPTISEQRKNERVEAYLHGVTAGVDGAPECLVLNVSETGLSIVSSRNYSEGQQVVVRLVWNGLSWTGDADVRWWRSSNEGAYIYGVRAARGSADAGLLEGLARVSATLKFQQTVMKETQNARG